MKQVKYPLMIVIVVVIIIVGRVWLFGKCTLDKAYHGGSVITATQKEGPVKVEVPENQPGYVYQVMQGANEGAIVDIRSHDARGRICLGSKGRIDDQLDADNSQFSILYSGLSHWSFVTKGENANFNLRDWSWDPGKQYVYLDSAKAGMVGVGVYDPKSKLDIKGAHGYNQLRMRKWFTPDGTVKDPRGDAGNLAWDEHYLYIKTNDGWKRAKLETF
jgi:hypothetical protein